MQTTIANSQLSASVASTGAELQSLVKKSSDEEYLWQGDPAVWSGRAPILFPIVGALRDNEYQYRGKSYSLAKHGLARHAEFELEAQSDDQLTYSLVANSETLTSYPWKFKLQIRYKLQDSSLLVRYRVYNLDTSIMIFALGSHPAFRLPLQDSAIEDFAIRFDKTEKFDHYLLNNDGLLVDEPETLAADGNEIRLTNTLFDRDALVFKNINSSRISLMHGQQTRLTVAFSGEPHLGIWAKPAAPYVCIEPWYSYSDSVSDTGDLEQKPSMLQLLPEQVFDSELAIEL